MLVTFKEWRQKIQEAPGGPGITKKDCPGPNDDYQIQGAVCGVPGMKSEKSITKKSKKMKKK